MAIGCLWWLLMLLVVCEWLLMAVDGYWLFVVVIGGY